LSAQLQELDLGGQSLPAAGFFEASDEQTWSPRRMLAAAVALSLGLWAPIVFAAAKVIGS